MPAQPAPPQILNTALAALGQEPVADLSDASLQSSIAAVKLLRQAETARDVVLRRHGWLCALTYVTLEPTTIPGYVAPARFPAVYKLPGDFLRLWSIDDCDVGGYGAWVEWPWAWRSRWELGALDSSIGGYPILRSTDAPGVPIGYTRRAPWGAIDAHVQDAIAYELAARCAYTVTGDLQLEKARQAEAGERLMLAISVDATQASPEDPLGYSHVRLGRLACA